LIGLQLKPVRVRECLNVIRQSTKYNKVKQEEIIPMYVVREDKDVIGLPIPNETRLVITEQMPEQHLVTCAFVLAFKGNDLLLTNLNDRGRDIPGGHIEEGEIPEEAARRELYEETGATVDTLSYLGFEVIKLFGEKPEGYKYPFPNSYMFFYCARITSLDEYIQNTESAGRALFNSNQAIKISWVQDNLAMYEEALKRLTNVSGIEEV
jgi:8-oxo-dGTP diphosphatase